MRGRSFIGAPAAHPKAEQVGAVRLDADFILGRLGLRLTSRADGHAIRFGVANGVGIVLAESASFVSLTEWTRQLERK